METDLLEVVGLPGGDDVPVLEAVQETVEITEAPDNFMAQPFDDYTVTEGLLFFIALLLVLLILRDFWRWCTSWL